MAWRFFDHPAPSFAQKQLTLLEADPESLDDSRKSEEFPSPYFDQPLSVPKGAYYPNPRAEKVIQTYLADHTTEVAGKTALDIGTGVGVLALALAQHGASRIVATDITPESIEATKQNSARFNFSEKIETVLIRDAKHIYKELDPNLKFDVLVSNPPFQRVFIDPERSMAFFREMVSGVSERLAIGGVALFYISDFVAHRAVLKMAHETGLEVTAHSPYLISAGDLENLVERNPAKDRKKSKPQRREMEKYFLVPRHESLGYHTPYPGLIVMKMRE